MKDSWSIDFGDVIWICNKCLQFYHSTKKKIFSWPKNTMEVCYLRSPSPHRPLKFSYSLPSTQFVRVFVLDFFTYVNDNNLHLNWCIATLERLNALKNHIQVKVAIILRHSWKRSSLEPIDNVNHPFTISIYVKCSAPKWLPFFYTLNYIHFIIDVVVKDGKQTIIFVLKQNLHR